MRRGKTKCRNKKGMTKRNFKTIKNFIEIPLIRMCNYATWHIMKPFEYLAANCWTGKYFVCLACRKKNIFLATLSSPSWSTLSFCLPSKSTKRTLLNCMNNWWQYWKQCTQTRCVYILCLHYTVLLMYIVTHWKVIFREKIID
jgi:hypothetical protein